MNIENKKSRSFQNKPMSEINVTPLVDVMLVLLIIFMITAPLLTTGVPVELPTTDSEALPGQDEPLTITINNNKEIFIGDNLVKVEALKIKLNAIANLNKESRIFIRADGLLPYGEVMILMSLIKKAGYNKVALLTKQKIEKEN
jgi:biopolymer transport protein TolR